MVVVGLSGKVVRVDFWCDVSFVGEYRMERVCRGGLGL